MRVKMHHLAHTGSRLFLYLTAISCRRLVVGFCRLGLRYSRIDASRLLLVKLHHIGIGLQGIEIVRTCLEHNRGITLGKFVTAHVHALGIFFQFVKRLVVVRFDGGNQRVLAFIQFAVQVAHHLVVGRHPVPGFFINRNCFQSVQGFRLVIRQESEVIAIGIQELRYLLEHFVLVIHKLAYRLALVEQDGGTLIGINNGLEKLFRVTDGQPLFHQRDGFVNDFGKSITIDGMIQFPVILQ